MMKKSNQIEQIIAFLNARDYAKCCGAMKIPDSEQIQNVLQIISHTINDVTASAAILSAVSKSFAPVMCLKNWCALIETDNAQAVAKITDSENRIEAFCKLFSFSQSISEQLINALEHVDYLIGGALDVTYSTEKFHHLLNDYIANIDPDIDPRSQVRQFKQREMLRIAMRDMLGIADLKTTAGEIAWLAEAIVQFCLWVCREQLEKKYGPPLYTDEHGEFKKAQFCVVGMGKLGGHELNVSSDLDLIFIYSYEGETEGVEQRGKRLRQISNHQFFAMLSESLIRFLMDRGGSTKLYRIDVRLRPDGESGPLARSMASYQNYLMLQARIWEKLALIKCRAIAGEHGIGQWFETIVRRFVFDANPIPLLLREILSLKNRIDNEVYRKGIAQREVKRGRGGIREIEFQVSAIQLINGNKNYSIRRRSTLEALDALLSAELLSRQQFNDLRKAYIWLRTVEHRLQYLYDQQEHVLPESPGELERLARRCGIKPHKKQSAREVFEFIHGEHTAKVHRWFNDIFGPAQKELIQQNPGDEIWIMMNPEIDPTQLQEILDKYNFKQSSAIKTIRRLAYGTNNRYITKAGQQFFESIFPHLMRQCSIQPNPDKALNNFEDFLLNSGGITSYYGFMIEYPPVLQMLIKIFGSSDFLSKILVHHPESLDLLVNDESLGDKESTGLKKDEIMGPVLSAKATEVAMNRLRRYFHQQILRIGNRFLLGISAQLETAQSISRLLRVSMTAAFKWSLQKLQDKHGVPRETQDGKEARFIIMGLGKLGAGELCFFSDLDIVYIFDGDGFTDGEAPISNREFYVKLASRIHDFMNKPTPEGKLFPLDARLRPEGKSGPITVSLKRFEKYFSQEARVWEYQAYLRSCCVCGDNNLYKSLRNYFWQHAIQQRDKMDLKKTIFDMRMKMEASVKLPSWASHDFKRGPGGVVDIEFLAQYFQLQHGAEVEQLNGKPTVNVLQIASDKGWIEKNEAENLITAFRWFRFIEMANRLLFETSSNLLPQKEERLQPLRIALQDHHMDPTQTIKHLEDTRQIFNKYMCGE